MTRFEQLIVEIDGVQDSCEQRIKMLESKLHFNSISSTLSKVLVGVIAIILGFQFVADILLFTIDTSTISLGLLLSFISPILLYLDSSLINPNSRISRQEATINSLRSLLADKAAVWGKIDTFYHDLDADQDISQNKKFVSDLSKLRDAVVDGSNEIFKLYDTKAKPSQITLVLLKPYLSSDILKKIT